MSIKAQDIVLPALGISYDTAPDASPDRSEYGTVLGRFDRLQAEYLYMGSGLSLEMQARGNDLSIVEHHYGRFRKQIRKLSENKLVHDTVAVTQELGRIAFRKRIFGNPLVREGIIVILYTDNRYHRENSKLTAKLHIPSQIRKKQKKLLLDRKV